MRSRRYFNWSLALFNTFMLTWLVKAIIDAEAPCAGAGQGYLGACEMVRTMSLTVAVGTTVFFLVAGNVALIAVYMTTRGGRV